MHNYLNKLNKDYLPNHAKLHKFQIPTKGSAISILAKHLGLDDPCHVNNPKEYIQIKSIEQIDKECKKDPLIQDWYFEDVVKEKGVIDDSYKDDTTWNIADDNMLIDYVPKMEEIRNKKEMEYKQLKARFKQYEKVYREQKESAEKSQEELDDIVDKTAYKAAAIEKIRGLCVMGSEPFNWKLYNQCMLIQNGCKTPWGSTNCIAFKQHQTKEYKKISQNSIPLLLSPTYNIQHIDNTNTYGGDLCDEIIDYLTRNEGLTDPNILKCFLKPYQMYIEPTISIKGNGMIKQSQLLRIQMFGPHYGHPTHSALNGQFGVKVIQNVPKGTILGEYKGIYFMDKEFLTLWNKKCIDYNMCMIDGFDLFLYTASDNIRQQRTYQQHIVLNTNNSYYKTFQFASYINDPRRDFYGKGVVTKDDMKYWNVDFVVYYVNGWPRVFIITKRDVEAGEELMAYYNGSINDDNHRFWKGITLDEKEHFKYKIRRMCRGIDMMPFPSQVIEHLMEQNKKNIMDDDDDSVNDIDLDAEIDLMNNNSEIQMAFKASIQSKEQDDINMAIRSSMNEQENNDLVETNHNNKNSIHDGDIDLKDNQISQWEQPELSQDIQDNNNDVDEVIFDEEDEIPEGWFKYYDNNNLPYYYNVVTGKSQWKVPVEPTNSDIDNDEKVQTTEQSLDKIIAEKKKRVSDKMEMDADEEEIESQIERVTRAIKKKKQTLSNDNRSDQKMNNDEDQPDKDDEDVDISMIPNPVLPSPPDPF